MEERPSTSWIRLVCRKSTCLGVLLFLAGGASTYFYLHRVAGGLVERVALDHAEAHIAAAELLHALYRSEVEERARAQGIELRADYRAREAALPAATTFTLLFAGKLSAEAGGFVRIHSDHPFPGGAAVHEARDEFARSALEFLGRSPEEPYVRYEEYQGRPALRYARAMVMQSECVRCHNENPQSPKRDWKAGEFAGVAELTFPLDAVTPPAIHAALRHVWTMGGAFALLLGGFICVSERLRAKSSALAARQNELRRQVSERERAELQHLELERLANQHRESEARLRSILAHAADGIVNIDERGIIQSFNAAASAIFGYEPEEVIGRDVSLLLPAGEVGRHADHARHYAATGESPVVGKVNEVQGRRRDGTIFPMTLAVSSVRTESGYIFTGIARDLSERKRLENQLLQAQKLESIGQLAAGIAHEINTPIQFVGDNVEFLDEAFGDLANLLGRYRKFRSAVEAGAVSEEDLAAISTAEEEADLEALLCEIPSALQQSREGAQRVSKIVRAMKEFSHPGGAEKASVDLNKAIESTVTVSRNEWKYVAELETDLDPDLPPVPCHAGEINQAVLNIVVNAAHAIGEKLGEVPAEKGHIAIRTRSVDGMAEIRISDDGGGIPEEVQDRIFDPFFTTKEIGKGSGQGLAIARSVVVEKHGGSLEFESDPGAGTTFVLRLPLRQDAAAEGEAAG